MKLRLFIFSESRICPNIYLVRIFTECLPNVPKCDWTHDIIIVKWPLLIWHNRKLCALTNAPRFNPHKRVNDYQRYSMLTILPVRSMSCTLGNSSSPWAAGDDHFLQVLQSTERKEGYFETFFVYLMMTNVMVKTCLHQKIIKNSNLIQAMKNSVCPKAKVIRRPNFSESRICPNIYRMFRSVVRTHDMIIVKWHEVTTYSVFRKPNICPNITMVPKCGLNTRHDNREVALIHLTQAQTLRSDKCATGSIHTNGSMTINVIPC